METEFKNGVSPDRLIFCSFTKKAVNEAIERSIDRFNFTKSDMVYFKTFHALGFKTLGLARNNMMSNKDYRQIGEFLGLEFSKNFDAFSDDGPGKKYNGDQYSFIYGFSRARQITPGKVWDIIPHDNLNWFEYKRYQKVVEDYKKEKHLFDFADLLESNVGALDVDVVIIDEAQDLSTAQWKFALRISQNAKRIYIAGDDDQTIFSWSGADVNYFLNLKGEKEVLTQSYRIPKKIHKLATDLSSRIKHRIDKKYFPKDSQGEIEYWHDISHLDMSSGTWLLLARNSYMLREIAQRIKEQGYNFNIKDVRGVSIEHVSAIRAWENWRKGLDLSVEDRILISKHLPSNCVKWPKELIWHEALLKIPLELREYYISILRRGESIIKAPRISINTIHGTKGSEAEHVVLLSDIAYSTWDAQHINADAEHRVWYVAATRAKESLNIILPRTRYNYNI